MRPRRCGKRTGGTSASLSHGIGLLWGTDPENLRPAWIEFPGQEGIMYYADIIGELFGSLLTNDGGS